MKFFKNILLPIICTLLLFSCVTTKSSVTSTSKDKTTETTGCDKPQPTFYAEHKGTTWKSSINPHDVIRCWKQIGVRPINSSMRIYVYGNPKIDWSVYDITKSIKFRAIPVPEGEKAACMMIVFVRDRSMKVHLFSYSYLKKETKEILYYTFDPESNCYGQSNIKGEFINKSI